MDDSGLAEGFAEGFAAAAAAAMIAERAHQEVLVETRGPWGNACHPPAACLASAHSPSIAAAAAAAAGLSDSVPGPYHDVTAGFAASWWSCSHAADPDLEH